MLNRWLAERFHAAFGVHSVSGRTINSGECIVPDSQVTTLVVEIQSLNTVCPDVVKRLIQQRFKVVGIQKVEITSVVK